MSRYRGPDTDGTNYVLVPDDEGYQPTAMEVNSFLLRARNYARGRDNVTVYPVDDVAEERLEAGEPFPLVHADGGRPVEITRLMREFNLLDAVEGRDGDLLRE
ncbi:MAG: hypothetical protein SVU88_04990 [Candidatus Nanohaloarchaea archaeon]|nr:hypothetical protein [Candidatus Nanohaloarchaea archaeon]